MGKFVERTVFNMREGSFRRKKINFSQVSNYAMWDEELSLQAKGLYGLIASMINIPDFILYKTTLQKKAHVGKDAFHKYWTELKTKGYLIQYEARDEKGHIYYEYELLDHPEKPASGNTASGFSVSGKTRTLIKQQENKTNLKNIDIKHKNNKSDFVPPTIKEVRNYCNEINSLVDPEEFYDYYQRKDWPLDKNGEFDWKWKIRQWGRKAKKNEKIRVVITSDDIFNTTLDAKTVTVEEFNKAYENFNQQNGAYKPDENEEFEHSIGINTSMSIEEVSNKLACTTDLDERVEIYSDFLDKATDHQKLSFCPPKDVLMEKFNLNSSSARYFAENWKQCANKFV